MSKKRKHIEIPRRLPRPYQQIILDALEFEMEQIESCIKLHPHFEINLRNRIRKIKIVMKEVNSGLYVFKKIPQKGKK